MATIDKRPNGRYRARWREYPGGPQKTRHFDRKGDAQQFLDGVRGDLTHGLYIDPAGARTLFATTPRRGGRDRCTGRAPRLRPKPNCGCTPIRRSAYDRSAPFVEARSKPG